MTNLSTETQLTREELVRGLRAAARWIDSSVWKDINSDDPPLEGYTAAYKNDLAVMRNVYRRLKL